MSDPVSANRSVGSNIGASAPGRDWLGFGVETEFQPSRVAEWLELSAADLARVADVPGHGTDSAPMSNRLIEVAALCSLVVEVFGGNLEKSQRWFNAVNPLLGDVAPRDMIRLGRFERLRMFIESSLQGQ